ncbi:MAG: 30S ribosomal protein S6 [Candidatus Hydrogenedentota bacterium]
MNLNSYEAVLVFPIDITDEEKNNIVEIIRKNITPAGGNITSENTLYKRTLTYKVKKKQEGIYYLIEFASAGDAISQIDSQLRIQEKLLTFIIVRKEKHKLRKKPKEPKRTKPAKKKTAKKDSTIPAKEDSGEHITSEKV